jgi:hypothetical protein
VADHDRGWCCGNCDRRIFVSFLLRVGGIGTKATAAADVTAPALVSAQIPAAGTTLEITFTEAVSIGAGGNGGFTIALSGGAATLTYASGSGSGTLVYTINRTVSAGETCSDFDYTQPGNGVEDAAGNDLATFTNQQALVTNNSTADSTAPTLSSASIPTTGDSLSIVFNEAVSIGAGGTGGFTIAMSGGAVTLTYSSGSGSNTLVYTTSRTITSGETCSDFDYTQPTNGVEDAAGNDLVSFSNQQASVTNNSSESGGGDPYWADVVVLALNENSADGTTTYVDQSSYGRTFTRTVTTLCEWEGTAASPYPSSATTVGVFVAGRITAADAAELELGGNDFTVETFYRAAGTGSQTIIGNSNASGSEYGWEIQALFSSSIAFNASSNGTSYNLHSARAMKATWSTGVWYHLAVTREGNVWRGFVDGVMGFEQTVAGSIANLGTALSIGARPGGTVGVNGYVVGTRITNGSARYTADFTPPSLPFLTS